MLGKKLYKTSMMNLFRVMVLAVVVFFFNDFYLQTISDESFQSMLRLPTTFASRLMTFLKYHYQYPADFISFMLTIIVPAIYFAFIRGVRFHEKGFVFNRGVPFLDQTIDYAEVKNYKLLHPELAISLHTKSGDSFVIADNNVERVIAILDQHSIPGDLAQDEYVKMIANYRKLIIVGIIATVVIFIIRKLGLFFR